MSISRRRMLALVGGGTLVAASAGVGGFAMTRTPNRALAPWEAAATYTEPRRRALAHALLAPNPHNIQPWLVDLSGDASVNILRDPARGLPETDPFSRQIIVGMGCFLELMVMAASQTGHGVALELFPNGEDGPIAQATFIEGGAEPDPLFAALQDRRSTKEPYEAQTLADAHIERLAEYADIVTDPARVAEITALTWAAWQIESGTPAKHKESVDLMRIGRAEINAQPDGIDLGGPFLEGLAAFGMLSRKGQMDPTSSEYAQGLALYDTMLHATPSFGVITTPGNSRVDQINAGRRWMRLDLTAAALGVAIHPVSQTLQEYPEMAEHYARAHDLLAPEGHTVQMLGRLGYGPSVPRSPRWPLEQKLVG